MDYQRRTLATVVFAIVTAISAVVGAVPTQAATVGNGTVSSDGRWVVSALDPSPAQLNRIMTAEFERWRQPSAERLGGIRSDSTNSALCQSQVMAKRETLEHYLCPAAIVAPYRMAGEAIAKSQYPTLRVTNPIYSWYKSVPHRELLWEAGARTIEFASVCRGGFLWSTARTNGVSQAGYVIHNGDKIDVNHMNVALSCAGNTLVVWEPSTGLNPPTALAGCQIIQPDPEYRSLIGSDAGGQTWRLYSAVFSRNPDRQGFDYWLDARRSGASHETVAYSFVVSGEFQNRYGRLEDREFVEQVYRNVFCRNSDPEGASYWTRLLNQGLARHEFLIHFTDSVEYRTLTNT